MAYQGSPAEVAQQVAHFLSRASSSSVPLSAEEGQQLAHLMVFLQDKYYKENAPMVDDATFDRLYVFLKQTEASRSDALDEQPTSQRVGSDLQEDGRATIAHHVPMLSLENAFEEADLRAFDMRVAKALGDTPYTYIIEPKIDGLSISLRYVNDVLVEALTRGNGESGESVLLQVREIPSIPQRLALSEHSITACEIRGEVYLSKKDFAAINASLSEQGKAPFSNPRNLASGSLRLKDPKQVRERKLKMMAYQMVLISGTKDVDTQHEVISFLANVGMPTTAELLAYEQDINAVIATCKTLEEKRDSFPFEIDGLVIKVNEISSQKRIGETSHHPKWAIALKLKAQSQKSHLRSVDFQVSRNGTITPVGKIDPIHVAGALISSVSLFNQDFIEEKNLCLGDAVLVERAGDVIPYIAYVMYHERQGNETPIIFPTHCPSCSFALTKQDSQWRCLNKTCSEKIMLSIVHFVSKDALNIEGLGEKMVRKFVEERILHSVVDIFKLPYERMKTWEGLGEKSVENLRAAVEKSKQSAMSSVLYGLGIRYVGITTAETLCESIKHLCDLERLSMEELQSFPDVGDKVAQAVFQYFKDPQTLEMLRQLEALGVALDKPKIPYERVSEKLEGKSFLFTGKLELFSRKEAELFVKQHGGTVASGVHKHLHFLVAGKEAGSKLAKASKIPSIRLLSEAEFLAMMDEERPA